jgi:hypothetical protein
MGYRNIRNEVLLLRANDLCYRAHSRKCERDLGGRWTRHEASNCRNDDTPDARAGRTGPSNRLAG